MHQRMCRDFLVRVVYFECSKRKENQWCQGCDSLNSARVDRVLNEYLEKSEEGKQEQDLKAQDSWSLTPDYTPWLPAMKRRSDCILQCRVINLFFTKRIKTYPDRFKINGKKIV